MVSAVSFPDSYRPPTATAEKRVNLRQDHVDAIHPFSHLILGNATEMMTIPTPCLSIALSFMFVSHLSAQEKRFLRFDDAGSTRYGLIDGELVRVLDGPPWENPAVSSRTLTLSQVKPLVPTEPQIVLAAAYNFRSHLGTRTQPSQPQFFLKTPQCLIASGTPVRLPASAANAHYEAELVIVIGQAIENGTLAEATQAIFGFTCGNDVSERTWQETDVQWWRAKSSRTFGPVGPVIVSGLEWKSLRIRGVHNGNVAQDESAADMLFSPAELVQFASRYVALQPGDLVFTGSPGNTEPLRNGDVFEVQIDGIGKLSNPVIQESQAETP